MGPYEVTSKISADKIVVTNFRENFVEKIMAIEVLESGGKWHKARNFDDVFMEVSGEILILSNEK